VRHLVTQSLSIEARASGFVGQACAKSSDQAGLGSFPDSFGEFVNLRVRFTESRDSNLFKISWCIYREIGIQLALTKLFFWPIRRNERQGMDWKGGSVCRERMH
jgi:hypothetical protein